MERHIWLVVLAGLLTYGNVDATMKCNAYNFGVKGMATCALGWWQGNNFERNTASLNPQLSDLISNVIQHYNLNSTSIAITLQRALQTTSQDPLRKLVETAALAEPYALYAIMDAALGFGVTGNDMVKLGLPSLLANEGNMRRLYQSYFEISCTADIFSGLLSCLNSWASSNCEPEDKISVIMDIITKMAEFYCDGATLKTNLMSTINRDFGSVYADAARSLGIVKDSSQYIFNISSTSIFLNRTAMIAMGGIYQSTCGYLLDDFSVTDTVSDLLQMFASQSNVGVGMMVERLLPLQYQLTNCALRFWDKIQPGFFTQHAVMFRHLELLNERYGGKKLTLAEPERGDIRHTVMIYGDPHMKPYKIAGRITCPALGAQKYLTNAYFDLVGTAEPACGATLCQRATYVTSVKLSFFGAGIYYQTGKNGTMPSAVLSVGSTNSTFTERGGVKLEVVGSAVRITDENSAAVFVFRKFRHTYQITVRMGESVFDNSLGLLIVGCSNPTDITSSPALRRKRSPQCTAACVKAPEEFRDTCVFDCDRTGDTEVANITINVVEMETVAEEKDEEIYRMYPTTTFSSTTAGDPNGVVECLPSLLLIAAVALLSRIIW